MPKFDPIAVKKDLNKGIMYGLYWIYGPERFKSHEILRQIRLAYLGQDSNESLSIEKIDAESSSAAEVLDQAQGMGLFSTGKKFVWVRNAEKLKDAELLVEGLPGKSSIDDLSCVVVCMSESFDGRKKSSKKLLESAAVIECADVADYDRDAWIQSLAEHRKVSLTELESQALKTLEPWSLEIVDQEIQKLTLCDDQNRRDLIAGIGNFQLREQLIDAFLLKNRAKAIELGREIAGQPEISFPLMGLLTWNVRQLEQYMATRGAVRVNPYLQKNLDRWAKVWKLNEVQDFLAQLYQFDLNQKSTRLDPLGLWVDLAL